MTSKTYAFIDGQNLRMGVRSEGWELDYRKFRLYLTNKYKVSRAYLFIGLVPGNESMYRHFQEMGYILVFKPTMPVRKGQRTIVKGNIDAELVLHASAITFDQYDKAVIVSNDGDFYCLIDFLVKENKLLKLLAPNAHYSSLLRQYDSYIVQLDKLRHSLEYKKTRTGGRSKP